MSYKNLKRPVSIYAFYIFQYLPGVVGISHYFVLVDGYIVYVLKQKRVAGESYLLSGLADALLNDIKILYYPRGR